MVVSVDFCDSFFFGSRVVSLLFFFSFLFFSSQWVYFFYSGNIFETVSARLNFYGIILVIKLIQYKKDRYLYFFSWMKFLRGFRDQIGRLFQPTKQRISSSAVHTRPSVVASITTKGNDKQFSFWRKFLFYFEHHVGEIISPNLVELLHEYIRIPWRSVPPCTDFVFVWCTIAAKAYARKRES